MQLIGFVIVILGFVGIEAIRQKYAPKRVVKSSPQAKDLKDVSTNTDAGRTELAHDIGKLYIESYESTWKGRLGYIVKLTSGAFPADVDLVGLCSDGHMGSVPSTLHYVAQKQSVGTVVKGDFPHVKFVYVK